MLSTWLIRFVWNMNDCCFSQISYYLLAEFKENTKPWWYNLCIHTTCMYVSWRYKYFLSVFNKTIILIFHQKQRTLHQRDFDIFQKNGSIILTKNVIIYLRFKTSHRDRYSLRELIKNRLLTLRGCVISALFDLKNRKKPL